MRTSARPVAELVAIHVEAGILVVNFNAGHVAVAV
jgi:hypothetical protein